MEMVYPLTPEDRLLSAILNTGVKLPPGKERKLRKTLTAILKTLPPPGEQALRLRFGIGNPEHGKTLAAIGAEFQVTRERIRQIEQRALHKLRLPHCIHRLQQAFDLSHLRAGTTNLSGEARRAWGPPIS